MAWTEWDKVHKEKTFHKLCEFDDGLWGKPFFHDTENGWTEDSLNVDNGKWINIPGKAPDSDTTAYIVWRYEHGLDLTPSTIKSFSVSMIEPTYGIRIPANYASDGTTAQYIFTRYIGVVGDELYFDSDVFDDGNYCYKSNAIAIGKFDTLSEVKRFIQVRISSRFVDVYFYNKSTATNLLALYTKPKFDIHITWE